MGRIQADPSPNSDYQVSPHPEVADTLEDAPPPPYESYTDETHQGQDYSSNPLPNEPQTQPAPPYFQQQPPPAYPPHNINPQPYANANLSSQPPPVSYPPPSQNQSTVAPCTPPQPTYPPPSPHQAYAPQPQAQPVQYPPPAPSKLEAFQQASSDQPVQFPPPSSTKVSFQAPSEPVAQFPPPPAPRSPMYQPAPGLGPQVYYNGLSPQPTMGVPLNQFQPPTEGWSSGLLDCMNDPQNALITACFPCVTFGQIAEIIDNGQTSCGTSGMMYGLIAFFIGLPFLLSCTYRTKLRSRFGLIETPAPDWVTHCFCEWCALCQEYRELQHRGFDPSIGWLGNMAKIQQQQQQVQMVPPTNQTMMG